ncbi:MAG: hypothetical protein NTZ09_01340 [Candidatus Hydrogenedentes bacterium]|nr:hypothetical protein [Candidatus Hydrogenedentota bacterium]
MTNTGVAGVIDAYSAGGMGKENLFLEIAASGLFDKIVNAKKQEKQAVEGEF